MQRRPVILGLGIHIRSRPHSPHISMRLAWHDGQNPRVLQENVERMTFYCFTASSSNLTILLESISTTACSPFSRFEIVVDIGLIQDVVLVEDVFGTVVAHVAVGCTEEVDILVPEG